MTHIVEDYSIDNNVDKRIKHIYKNREDLKEKSLTELRNRREALIYILNLYENGKLDSDFISIDKNKIMQKISEIDGLIKSKYYGYKPKYVDFREKLIDKLGIDRNNSRIDDYINKIELNHVLIVLLILIILVINK